MKKVLVLGTSGMLGSMVYNYLSKIPSLAVVSTSRKKIKFWESYFFDALQPIEYQFEKIFCDFYPDYIINCIGIIKPFCKDGDRIGCYNAITVNALFPHNLSNVIRKLNGTTKIIQIATDCVYSGSKGLYNEDDIHDPHDCYGKTKSLGEVIDDNFLNIRCSIIGHEIWGNHSLLEWFLSNPDGSEIFGYDHHLWNGITTLQFAKLCERLIVNDEFNNWRTISGKLHYVPNEIVSKYQLLNIFKEVYEKKISIKRTNNVGLPIDRTLDSKYIPISQIQMKQAIVELKNYSMNAEIYTFNE